MAGQPDGDWFRMVLQALRRVREDDRRGVEGPDDPRWVPLAALAVVATVAAVAGVVWLIGALTG